MEVALESVQGVAVVVIPESALEAGNTAEFKADVNGIIAAGGSVVFDLKLVQFVDSSGLGAILSCLRQLKARGGELAVCGLRAGTRALFDLVRMDRVLSVYGTSGEAVAGLVASIAHSRDARQ